MLLITHVIFNVWILCAWSIYRNIYIYAIFNVVYVKHFRYGGGYDLASRRKNATRESTATLKAWLSEHKKNPYPTKGEKIMLAIITKMTLTQVSASKSFSILRQLWWFYRTQNQNLNNKICNEHLTSG